MENFIVSARKYRPATFATVIGQSSITNTLKNAIRNNQIAQAFLFTGPRGVGKTTCARILAKTINCSNITSEGEACNECPSCLSFNKSSSFNIFELDAASNNTVDDIRNLVDQVRIPPQHGYKVYIIDEVHMLSQQAFNAFLKTLEEPPAYAKFILATTEKHKILPTILSRCQIFDFRRINVDDIAHHLAFVAESEHIQAENEALHIIAQKADGGLRDALSMFDQLVSFAGNELTYKQVIENLNVLDHEYYFRIIDYILASDISNTLLTINEIFDNGFEGQHFLTGMGNHLRNLMVSKDSVTLKLMETSQSVKEEFNNQASQCPVPFLLEALDIVNKCDIDYKTSNNKKLHIEIALMQLCRINMSSGQPVAQPTPVAQPITRQPVKQTAPPVQSAPPVPQAPPVPPTPSAPQESPVAQAPQVPPVPQVTPVPPVPPTPSTPPVQQNYTATLTGLNLGNLMSGKKTQQADKNEGEEEEAPGESYGNESFELSDVLKVWPGLVNSIAAELPLLKHTLSASIPELDGTNITIYIESPLQEEEIFRNKPEITLYLRKALKNDSALFNTIIRETTSETRRPYTDTEKFNYLASKAPVLRIMKDQLGLELDM